MQWSVANAFIILYIVSPFSIHPVSITKSYLVEKVTLHVLKVITRRFNCDNALQLRNWLINGCTKWKARWRLRYKTTVVSTLGGPPAQRHWGTLHHGLPTWLAGYAIVTGWWPSLLVLVESANSVARNACYRRYSPSSKATTMGCWCDVTASRI